MDKPRILPPFAPGDIVTLRSGGTDMTVAYVHPTTGSIECVWHNFWGEYQRQTYGYEVLTRKGNS